MTSRWYEHYRSEHPVLEKVERNFNVESDHVIVHRRLHTGFGEEKNALLIDIAVLGDARVEEKEEERVSHQVSVSRARSQETAAVEDNSGSELSGSGSS